MESVRFDDCRFHVLDGIEQPAFPAATIADWFESWARSHWTRSRWNRPGVLLIHANGIFAEGGRRQDLQGADLLKHVRLTRWLGRVRTWHAIVYSFEPIEQILRRAPGNMILLSEGVTFLRLPDAIDLKDALARALPHLADGWRELSPEKAVHDLARRHPADPDSRSFRPFVAASYRPKDAAHDVSNLWGIYELRRAAVEIAGAGTYIGNFPEVDQPHVLADPVRRFVTSLPGKEAWHLEGDPPTRPLSETERARLRDLVTLVPLSTAQKRIGYIDDEAANGWCDLLRDLFKDISPESELGGELLLPDSMLVDYAKAWDATDASKRDAVQRLYDDKLATWVKSNHLDLLMLDLRLLGSREKDCPIHNASGLLLARAIRRTSPYLPILLFTASNKAEALTISRAFAVDDMWMKPGLGEHRYPGGGLTALTQLGSKVQRLVSDEYSWLRRVGDEVDAIAKKPTSHHWWEKSFAWPKPERVGGRNEVGPVDSYALPHGRQIRNEVISLVRSILNLSRSALRVSADWPESLGYFDSESLAAPLRAAAYNRVGQVVELIHGPESIRDPKFHARGLGARAGGFREPESSYVFRHCDWLAFRLVAFRNLASHPIDPSKRRNRLDGPSLKNAICDLVAWLGTPRTRLVSIDRRAASHIASSQKALPGHTRVAQALRMHPDDDLDRDATDKTLDCNEDNAILDGFRLQLRERSAFQEILKKSDELSGLQSHT